MVLFGVAVICIVLGLMVSSGVNVVTVFVLLIGLASLALGLWGGFGMSAPVFTPRHGLNENDVVVNVDVQPERITPTTQANLSLTIQNRNTSTLDLSTIELITPPRVLGLFRD